MASLEINGIKVDYLLLLLEQYDSIVLKMKTKVSFKPAVNLPKPASSALRCRKIRKFPLPSATVAATSVTMA